MSKELVKITEYKNENYNNSSSTSSNPINLVLEKYRYIEHNFNKNFLMFMYQVLGIVKDYQEEEDEEVLRKDKEQYEIICQSYKEWYFKLQAHPKSLEACTRLHDTLMKYDEFLKNRDLQLFTVDGDLFSNIFNTKGIDTAYLFDCLTDGSDGTEDAKENLWLSLISLNRLAVLICSYMKIPVVKEIIDMILFNNPDITPSNVFQKTMSQFKDTPKLRRLIFKLFKSSEKDFEDIFNSLQRVIASFSSDDSLDSSNLQNNINNMVANKLDGVFSGLLQKHNISLNEEHTKILLESLAEKDEIILQRMVEDELLSANQLEELRSEYERLGLGNANNILNSLGETMNDLMNAIKNNDEDSMQNIFEKTGSKFNIGKSQMDDIKAQMEELQKDFEDIEEGNEETESESEEK
jgi:hypothetical protein